MLKTDKYILTVCYPLYTLSCCKKQSLFFYCCLVETLCQHPLCIIANVRIVNKQHRILIGFCISR